MNQSTAQSFLELRDVIRNSTRQYRHNNDNSQSLLQPEYGFAYGYDVAEVEAALDNYQRSLPTELTLESKQLTPENALIQAGSRLSATNQGTVREFANAVIAYLTRQQHQAGFSPLRVLRSTTSHDELDE